MSQFETPAQRHLREAADAVLADPRIAGVSPRTVATVGVVGGGLMGCGIAYSALGAGYRVILAEVAESAADAAQSRLVGLLDRAVATNRLTEADKADRLSRLTVSASVQPLVSADLVIEAIFEDLGLKRQLFAALESIVSGKAILATNTSYLDVEAIAGAVSDRTRVAGLHFFSPAHVMKLVEVVRAAHTSPDVVATLVTVAKAMGKVPIITGVCEGFAGNRVLKAWRAEAETMLEQGASPAEIDAAMTGYGLAMGPFAVQDLASLEIAAANRKLNPPRLPDGRALDLVERLVAAGRIGQKAGRGWYDYAPGERQGTPSPEVAAIIEAAASEHGVARRSFSQQELLDRQLGAIRAEARRIVAEGIVASPADIDLAMVYGYGFPAAKGGPLFAGS